MTITFNEKTLGDRATVTEAQAAIATLQGKGYDVRYGEHVAGAALPVKPAHWRAAVKAAHEAAANAPTLRTVADLSLAEQIETLTRINAYLTELLCADLFGKAVTA